MVWREQEDITFFTYMIFLQCERLRLFQAQDHMAESKVNMDKAAEIMTLFMFGETPHCTQSLDRRTITEKNEDGDKPRELLFSKKKIAASCINQKPQSSITGVRSLPSSFYLQLSSILSSMESEYSTSSVIKY